eukprot:637853-Hanusia_phi.AAC.2
MGFTCGFCNETLDEDGYRWLRSGAQCIRCFKDQPAIAFSIAVCTVAGLFWLLVLCSPLLHSRSKGWLPNRIEEKMLAIMEKFSTFQEGKEEFVSILTTSSKIVIGYYQVTLSFVNNFYIVRWPDSMASLINSLSFMSLDFFSLPGTECMSASLKYADKLFGCSPRKRAIAQSSDREGYVLAAILPLYCISVRLFCNPANVHLYGFWIREEFSPRRFSSCVSDGYLGERIFRCDHLCFLYPLGIPLFMLAVLFRYDVPRLARRKLFLANLVAVLEKMRLATEDKQILKEIERKSASCPLNVDPLMQLSTLEQHAISAFLRKSCTGNHLQVAYPKVAAVEKHDPDQISDVEVGDDKDNVEADEEAAAAGVDVNRRSEAPETNKQMSMQKVEVSSSYKDIDVYADGKLQGMPKACASRLFQVSFNCIAIVLGCWRNLTH